MLGECETVQRDRRPKARLIAHLRMAKAAIRQHNEADVLLARIQDLYHQLQELPASALRRPRSGSPAYQLLEAQIRDYARRFWKLTE